MTKRKDRYTTPEYKRALVACRSAKSDWLKIREMWIRHQRQPYRTIAAAFPICK